MKRAIPCLLLLRLLTSCVVQEGYYEPGYYPPPPPPPYVEVHRYEHHHRPAYRPAPQARVYQGHTNNQGSAQVHGNTHRGGQAVGVNPRQPQSRPMPQQTPPQAQVPANAHGRGANGPAAKSPAQVMEQQNNVSGHN